jgi:hypothetical protein
MRLGSLVSLPAVPEDSQFTASFSVSLAVTNNHPSDALPLVYTDLVLASEDDENIYVDGAVIGTGSLGPLPAGKKDSVDFTATITEGNPAFSQVKSGSFRIGIFARFDPNPGAEIPVVVLIEEVMCEIRLRLYSLFTVIL